MTMKRFFIATCLLALSSQALWAQLYCRNNTNQELWVAVAYSYVPADAPGMSISGQDDWISEGWYSIPPKGTVQLTSHIGYDPVLGSKTNFYYYAMHQGGREYSGGRFYLIDNAAPFTPNKLSFRIEKASNKNDYHPNVSNLHMRAFIPATVQESGEFIIEVNGDEINDEPIIHDLSHEESYFK